MEVMIGIGCALAVGWITWVSFTLVKNYNNHTDVGDLKKAFIEMEERFTKSLDKITERQDRFMQTEIQELKKILKQ